MSGPVASKKYTTYSFIERVILLEVIHNSRGRVLLLNTPKVAQRLHLLVFKLFLKKLEGLLTLAEHFVDGYSLWRHCNWQFYMILLLSFMKFSINLRWFYKKWKDGFKALY